MNKKCGPLRRPVGAPVVKGPLKTPVEGEEGRFGQSGQGTIPETITAACSILASRRQGLQGLVKIKSNPTELSYDVWVTDGTISDGLLKI